MANSSNLMPIELLNARRTREERSENAKKAGPVYCYRYEGEYNGTDIDIEIVPMKIKLVEKPHM